MTFKKIIKNLIYQLNRNPLSVYFYQQEIKKRKLVYFTDIKNLAKPINMFSPFTSEIHQPNDWYAHARAFKKYMNLPDAYKFKFLIEHGVYLTEQIDALDIETDLPSVVTYCDFRANLFENLNIKAFSVGPFINYSESFLNKNQMKSEKDRLGRCLLVFPNHSSFDIEIGYNAYEFCKRIKKLGKDFDTIRVCLHWTDVVLGKYQVYLDYGFECITAGHALDPYFLSRLRSIIELSDASVSNSAGTHVGYSVFLKKPHIILLQKFNLKTSKYWKKRIGEFWQSKPYLDVVNAFTTKEFKITAKQKNILEKYWGSKNIKTKKEFRKIIQETEKIYSKL